MFVKIKRFALVKLWYVDAHRQADNHGQASVIAYTLCVSTKGNQFEYNRKKARKQNWRTRKTEIKSSQTECNVNVTFVRKLALVFSGIGSFQFQLNEYKIVWTNRWPHFKASSTRIRIILKTEVLIISSFSKNRRPHVPYIWIVFARPHEHAKTMEIPIACSQGMRCMMYGIILFGNLRFPRFTQKR